MVKPPVSSWSLQRASAQTYSQRVRCERVSSGDLKASQLWFLPSDTRDRSL